MTSVLTSFNSVELIVMTKHDYDPDCICTNCEFVRYIKERDKVDNYEE